ncbi:hypothetical protein O0555_01265 [Brevibacillus laterosporus]|nr:hypothetical protein [Brevibacillus laterosporus]MCR8935990.1 hypothetical protein [Brevibacillus laterosporus]MCZ0838629.1 hypothetical protein [Brevibacillus laterosporus]MCZ0843212.1 hypothetical protein [Brevibacillus laterosporus]
MKKWGFLLVILFLLLGYKTILQDADYTKKVISIVKNMRSLSVIIPKL